MASANLLCDVVETRLGNGSAADETLVLGLAFEALCESREVVGGAVSDAAFSTCWTTDEALPELNA